MISRRGFFGMLAGLAAAPAAIPLAKVFEEEDTGGFWSWLTRPIVHNPLADRLRVYYDKQFTANLIANLRANTPLMCRLTRPTPAMSGKTIHFFPYDMRKSA